MLLVILTATSALRASPNLIVNGGFEDPAVGAGGFQNFAGGTSFTGWDVGLGGIDVHHTLDFTAFEGGQFVDLSGAVNAGSITQMVPTTIGQTYTLSFAYAGHPFHPYVGNAFAEVEWDGLVIATVDRPPAPSNGSGGFAMNYLTGTFTVTATQTLTALTFESLSPNGGILLDAVSLVPGAAAIPEPAELGLGAGVLALGLAVWRRRRRK